MKGNPVKISAVIITKNEASNIKRCLESLVDIADEIVVVDSFSEDNTEEICRQYVVKFIKHKFEGHIEQKNFAVTQATYPHILSLDADEALSAQLKNSIKEAKYNWDYDGYYFNRLTNYCGQWIKHSGWYPDRKLRLWDSRKGKWQGKNPHDKFVLENGSKQRFLKGDLLHYSIKNIEHHLQIIHNYSSISAQAKFEKNQKSNIFKIIVNPAWKFIKDYFINLGFLDGYYGFIICKNSAYATYLKYKKLKNLYKSN